VRLWDPATGTALRTLKSHTRGVRALAVDPGGHWLASAGGDRTVRLWDPATGSTLRTLEGHTDWVNALAADPGGRWLASAGADGTVRLWDLATGDRNATLLASVEGWAVLLPDGRFKLHGQPAGLWWAAGLCRFDAADLPELAQYQPHLRPLPDDAVILDVP
jgi:WD40 repeat protein